MMAKTTKGRWNTPELGPGFVSPCRLLLPCCNTSGPVKIRELSTLATLWPLRFKPSSWAGCGFAWWFPESSPVPSPKLDNKGWSSGLVVVALGLGWACCLTLWSLFLKVHTRRHQVHQDWCLTFIYWAGLGMLRLAYGMPLMRVCRNIPFMGFCQSL